MGTIGRRSEINAVGALTSIGTDLTGADPNATTNVVSSLSYTGFGATQTVSYGNGRRLTLGYDPNRHQMTSMIVDNQNGTDRIIDKTYSYTAGYPYNDNDGRIKKITDNLDPNYTATYTYDAFNRLSTASGGPSGDTYYRNYSYDALGNLLRVETSRDWQNATNYSVALATNRISSVTTQLYGWNTQTVNYTWDAAGNLTNDGLRTYTYDAAGRQKEAGATGQNTVGYDGDGQRVKKVENWGTPVYYVRSSVLKSAAMEVQGGTLARAYVYAGGYLVAQQSSDGQFYWLHKDHLGSGRKLTNTSGAVVYRGEFDPHGQALLETGSAALNSRKFTGYERDQATGLDYASARMYASNAARFTSPDPGWLSAANMRRPESLNRYAYVTNDPINFIDPAGLDLTEAGMMLACSLGIIGWYWCEGNRTKAGSGGGGGGADGGRGLIHIEPLPQVSRNMKLEALEGVAPQATDQCGEGAFYIRWQIKNLNRNIRGWIIQHVIRTNEVYDENGELIPPRPPGDFEYWEAWEVRGGFIFARYPVPSEQDRFQFGTEGKGTRGSRSQTGWAKFYQIDPRTGRAEIDPSSWRSEVAMAGILRSTRTPPSDWEDKGSVEHNLTLGWNCVQTPPTKPTVSGYIRNN